MDYLKENKVFKTEQRVRYVLSKPFECHGTMKKFFQCVGSFESTGLNFSESSEKCSEFDYKSCLTENSKKLFENRIFNVNAAVAEEEE